MNKLLHLTFLKTIFISIFLFSNIGIFAQNIKKDTILANSYFEKADELYKNKDYDSAAVFFGKSGLLYETNNLWRKYLYSKTREGICYQKKWMLDTAIFVLKPAIEKTLLNINENDTVVADAYHYLGLYFAYNSQLDSALTYWKKTLHIRRKLFGEKHSTVANIYNNIANIYDNKDEYDLALVYYSKDLQITKELHGERHISVAKTYNNIGNVYRKRNEYDLSLQYYLKSLKIKKELLSGKHTSIAITYNNIGNVYADKHERNLALQYYFKALQIRKALFGEKHIEVAASYDNIGLIYGEKNEYDLSTQYLLKSLQIAIELFGEKHSYVADSYNNVGVVYGQRNEYDLALQYLLKSLRISRELLGDEHTFVARIYNNIGIVYNDLEKFDLALKYSLNSLKIYESILGIKHTDVASICINIGNIYLKNKQYNPSLNYYQKAIASSLKNFNDTTNSKSVPIIKNYLNWDELLKALQAKAQIFVKQNKELENINKQQGLKLSIRHYQACDTLISDARQHILSKQDKIILGNKATEIYKEAIDVCIKLEKESKTKEEKQQYKELAFSFSEKNRAGILTEAIAGINLDTGIVRNAKYDIAHYKTKFAETNNDSLNSIYSQKLLDAYGILQNNNKNNNKIVKSVSVEDIQQQLNKETALIEYLVSDSILYVFQITKQDLKVSTIPLKVSINKLSDNYLKSITDGEKEDFIGYSNQLYNLLIKPLALTNKIKQLVIIPDGKLGIIPFEALITSIPKYKKQETVFADMDYLIKKYNISYHYSAGLWTKSLEMSREKQKIAASILACAPVTFNNRANVYQMPEIASNTKAGWQPLPETEKEVDEIVSLFNNKLVFKTKLLKNAYANEINFKNEASKYKFIHLSTHGVSDTIRPELSRVLLSQPIKDSTNLDEEMPSRYKNDDGFLYAGEMFFMNLDNCDLFVLSACETGVGKVMKGEGTMAMHRGLMYAGAPNIIYSLWQIPEKESKYLMLDFYQALNFDKDNKQNSYADALRKAKLKMIKQDLKPVFWAGLVLLGR